MLKGSNIFVVGYLCIHLLRYAGVAIFGIFCVENLVNTSDSEHPVVAERIKGLARSLGNLFLRDCGRHG